jgi:hypothetical protein
MGREKSETKIRDLFNPPTRFLRSTNLEKDFSDPRALESYTLTPFVLDAFHRILDGALPTSGRRAWRITGDYGVGKSSFALFLSQFLSDPRSRSVAATLKQADVGRLPKTARFIPVLVTGERERLATALARAVIIAFQQIAGRKPTKIQSALFALAEKVRRTGSSSALIELLDAAIEWGERQNSGILLVVDELGKFLEFAANNPETEDIFLLQTLAERAVRSGKTPFLFVGLLHQGFQAYSERLPHAQRHEWDKVAGRFEEVVFDQPLAHTLALTARALSVDEDRLPKEVATSARREMRKSVETGWFTRSATGDAPSLYPLHPLLLPVLIRFFARFGQHERSLFTFLLSNEPFGLQAFSEREVGAGVWYRIADFFDYVRNGIGHRLSGESYRSSWLRLVELADRAAGLPKLEQEIVKTVSLLNLLDAEDLIANDDVIAAAVGEDATARKAIGDLVEKGVLFKRGQDGGYRLWGASSVNLRAAFQEAFGSLTESSAAISAQLVPFLDARPIPARKHYLTTGTLRYFDVTYVSVSALQSAISKEPEADGAVVVALPETETERKSAQALALGAARDDVLIVVPTSLSGLVGGLKEAQAWTTVLASPELAADPFALAEADRQQKRACGQLSAVLEAAIGIRSTLPNTCEVYRKGEPVKFGAVRRLAPLVSETCSSIYTESPTVMNELLNRNSLSSAASAARMRLIEGLFSAPDRPLLGIDDERAPPEKSMYLSVLAKGNVHRESKGRHFVDEPPKDRDDLHLRPALAEIMSRLEKANEARIPVDDLLSVLRRPPFGVRDGVVGLLLAIILSTRAHEVAVYENGTFLHNFGAPEFLRLTKDPATFELQLCRVAGVRAEVFRKLLECFAEPPADRESELLDVVTPLCRFAAQLPEYTRRSSALDGEAIRVRDALLTSTEPAKLLFKDLPVACGMAPFETDVKRDQKSIVTFVSSLHHATGRLRDAYQTLLAEIVGDVARALDAGGGQLDRAKLAARASRVALAAREGRLRAFAQSLRDPRISEDSWIESLASFVASKPPARWTRADVDNWRSEIENLGATFLRLEAAAYASGPEPSKSAFRIGITRSDGSEIARVVDIPAEGDPQFHDQLKKLDKALPPGRDQRLAVLYRMLWDIIGPSESSSDDSDQNTKANERPA